MKILVDQAMPYWENFFSALGEVISFTAGDLALDPSHQICSATVAQHLSDIECLLVRSTTKVDDALLTKMPNLRFVATATAGYDHLDIAAIEARKIKWYVAGGCNAQAVTQYVVCALLSLATQDKFLISEKTVGVIGHGKVGSRVAKAIRALGATVIVYDPPQQALCIKMADFAQTPYVHLEEILTADIICMHAPLNSHTSYPTEHLFDLETLSKLTASQYLINAGRGELIDNDALLALLSRNSKHGIASVNVVLDVWEHEPNILVPLIPYLRLVSAHIAGHSLEGKANGTAMLYKAFCNLFDRDETIDLQDLLPDYNSHAPELIGRSLAHIDKLDNHEIQEVLKNLCHFVYDIQNDDRVFRHHMSQSTSFAKLRQQYPIRREFSALKLNVPNTKINELLQGIGFIITNDSKPLDYI